MENDITTLNGDTIDKAVFADGVITIYFKGDPLRSAKTVVTRNVDEEDILITEAT